MIITRKKVLGKLAIVILNTGQRGKILREDDFTIIYNKNDEIISINISNFKKYFSAKEGAHTFTEEQMIFLKKTFDLEILEKSKFLVGEILEIKNHPKSEKLFIISVEANKKYSIVTNVSSLEVGNKIVFAKVGATLPSGVEILSSKILEIESEGMVCMPQTLDLEKYDLNKFSKGDYFIF